MGTLRSEVKIDASRNVATSTASAVSRPRDPADPFRILVLGDLSGRAGRGANDATGIATRTCHAIDRDNFDDVVAAVSPRICVSLGGDGGVAAEITCRSIDDFHPDELFQKVDVFAQLRSVRRRLADPDTSAAAIRELLAAKGTPTISSSPSAGSAQPQPPPPADLLEGMLQATEAVQARTPRGESLVDRLVRELVAPHVTPGPHPQREQLVAEVDRAIASQMRAVLAAPAFRDVETAWLGVQKLTRELETDSRLSIHLLDVSLEELETSLPSAGDPLTSQWARRLVDQTTGVPGGVPFTVVIGAWTFGDRSTELELLGRLARICARAGSVFLAAASPAVFGCPGFAAGPDPDDWNRPPDPELASAWARLRGDEAASAVGLVAPRYLARLPYGARSSPTSAFPFEEETNAAAHEELTWANGAFLVALALAQEWRDSGWSMRPGAVDEVAGLPVHVRRVDGESVAVPVAEVELTSRGGERIATHGVIPLYSVRGADSARIGTLRSIAGDGRPLAGRWRAP